MDLERQVEEILRLEGLTLKILEAALRETFTSYQKYNQRMIDHAKENKPFSEYHLQCLEASQSLLKNVMKGKTTYQQEWSKIERDPEQGIKRREKDPQYKLLEMTLTMYVFHGYFDEIDNQVKLLDETIQRLYLSKPKKKRGRDPELWRKIL
jgi:hypothetical protein